MKPLLFAAALLAGTPVYAGDFDNLVVKPAPPTIEYSGGAYAADADGKCRDGDLQIEVVEGVKSCSPPPSI
jgi:hypothetical protein